MSGIIGSPGSKSAIIGDRGGVTIAKQYRTTSTYTGNSDGQPILGSRIEEVDTGGYKGLGPSFTVGSGDGVFTFPATGCWYISFTAEFQKNGDSRFNTVEIETSTTVSPSFTPQTKAQSALSQSESSYTYNSATCSMLFYVTATSTHKCRFVTTCSDSSGVEVLGESTKSRTFMDFIKLGNI